jgi:hypothetical protein
MPIDEARTARMKPILDRIPEEWGKYLPDAGWDDRLLILDRKISALDPDYVILQAKEKFGTLRFYTALSDGLPENVRDQIHDLIGIAEAQSAHVCERCGAAGAKARHTGWIKTLCDGCHANPRRPL